ncbi:MAG TPA: hypothetical protein VFG10_09665 [Saprospiraceae bacterium]|nr:hypothetical protein [Saprospiraceae bacterium]
METITKTRYKYWQEADFWIGYLEEFPDYMSQGNSLDELKENLSDLYKELSSGSISSVRRVGELDVS